MTDFTPKVGDKVRAIIEGAVTKIYGDGEYAIIEGKDAIAIHDFTFEKLVDPEPRWVNGDIVETAIGSRAVHLNGTWRWLSDGIPSTLPKAWWSKEWGEGNVRILYKADADT